MTTVIWTLTGGGTVQVDFTGTDGDANGKIENLDDGSGTNNNPHELTSLTVTYTRGGGGDPANFVITPSAAERLDPNFVQFSYTIASNTLTILQVVSTSGLLAVLYPDPGVLGCGGATPVAVIGRNFPIEDASASACYGFASAATGFDGIIPLGFYALMPGWSAANTPPPPPVVDTGGGWLSPEQIANLRGHSGRWPRPDEVADAIQEAVRPGEDNSGCPPEGCPAPTIAPVHIDPGDVAAVITEALEALAEGERQARERVEQAAEEEALMSYLLMLLSED